MTEGKLPKELLVMAALPVPDAERREKALGYAEVLIKHYEDRIAGKITPSDFKASIEKFADSILRLTQPLPEIPLAKVPDRLQDFGEDEHIWNEACETQLDLCLETLRKAGYEEKK